MRQQRRELDLAARLVDRGGLHRGDLVLAKALADDFEATGERSVAKGPVRFPREGGADGGGQGSLGVDEFALRLGQRRRDGADGFTGPVHG